LSHVATVDVHIQSLTDLRAGCERLGLEFVEGQETYRWYGQHVGDYPLPPGFTPEDLGKCVHAIRLRDQTPVEGELPYEVGVIERRDGNPGWQLIWDFWGGGYGLQAKVGEGCGLLKQAYAVEAAKRVAKLQGFAVTERTMANGEIKLLASR
jgi:hypothetical protein